MENASKALIMAGGVLIGILILSLAVYLFVDFGTTAAQINEQNAQSQIIQFNSQFTSYEGKDGLTIYDVITVAGYANENNKYYDYDEEYIITVKIGTRVITDSTEDEMYLEENKNLLMINEQNNMINNSLPTYSCKIEDYNENGRVKTIIFIKNT